MPKITQSKKQYETPQVTAGQLATTMYGETAPTMQDVIKSANARGQTRHEMKNTEVADIDNLPDSAAMVNNELVPRFTDECNHWFDYARTGGYLRHCLHRLEQFQSEYDAIVAGEFPTQRSHEYGSWIIEALETNQPAKIAGNVPNTGLITNLPTGCCVEVPCLVDASGIQPTQVGSLPPQLAALNRTNINVQSLIVEAALMGDTDAVYHAVMLDPLTAAVCTLPQSQEMVAEMLDAQSQWLPQFG